MDGWMDGENGGPGALDKVPSKGCAGRVLCVVE